MVKSQKDEMNEVPAREIAREICKNLYFRLDLVALVAPGSPLEFDILAERFDPSQHEICESAPYFVSYNLEKDKASQGVANLEGIREHAEEAGCKFYILGTPNRVKISRNGRTEDFLFILPISFVESRYTRTR